MEKKNIDLYECLWKSNENGFTVRCNRWDIFFLMYVFQNQNSIQGNSYETKSLEWLYGDAYFGSF